MAFPRSFWALLLVLVLCIQATLAQDPTSRSPTTNTESTTHVSSKSTSARPSSTSTRSTALSKSTSITQAPHPTMPVVSHDGSDNTDRNRTMNDLDLLPIKPEITPTFGLTGVLMILTGIAYTMVGIRKEWLHIFFSSAYLVALAVTVLVLYVCNPPISDAVQGAYFVGALLSGLIIGGLSLLFREVADGLGGLLGGFCLAMWFLCLKEGGLVTSLGGRVGMIASFSVVTCFLSFVKYTREYALMFGIAFAGASIVVIGIDFFSGAGLKEFWVYIWNLNDNIFPLHTITYPMTRGIKVEIAGVILLFLIGLLSQWKLYKILKARKEKKALARAQDDEAREHLEADLGRRIEDMTGRERALWEQRYGAFYEKDHASAAASAVGSANPSSAPSRAQSVKDLTISTREVSGNGGEVVEMKDLARSTSQRKSSSNPYENGGLMSISSPQFDEDGNFAVVYGDNPFGSSSHTLHAIAEDSSRTATMKSSQYQGHGQFVEKSYAFQADGSQEFKQRSLQPSAPPPPVVIPMPFSVNERELRDRDETESIATAGETAFGDEPVRRRSENRISAARSIRAVSDTDDSDDEGEALIVPHVEDDRSSLAATLDDLTDDEDDKSLPVLSRSASPTRKSVVRTSKRVSLRRTGSATDLQSLPNPPSLPDSAVSGVKAARRLSEPPPTDLVELVLSESDLNRPTELSEVLNLTTARPNKRKSIESRGQTSVCDSQHAPPSTAPSLSAVKSLKRPTMAAQKYRTHEWTKYLGDAELPEPGELEPSEDGVRVERFSQEVAAPVNVQSLQQTSRDTLQNARHTIQPTVGAGNQATLGRSGSNPTQSNPQVYTDTNPYRISRSISNQSVFTQPTANKSNPQLLTNQQRSFSQPIVATQAPRNFSSNIVSQPLVESPVEEGSVAGSNHTLLSMREDILRHKASTISLSRNYSMPNQHLASMGIGYSNSNPAFSETGSVRSYSVAPVDDDNISLSSLKQKLDEENMPLSRRRSLIQQGQVPSVNRLSGGSTPSNNPFLQTQQQVPWVDPAVRSALSSQNLIYDSHQPQRGPSVDAYTRQARMASFRENLRQEAGANSRVARGVEVDEGHRFAMLNEKRHAQAMVQQKEYEKQMLDNVVDQRMRNGAMLDLHKESLRRMQNQAQKTTA